VKVTFNNRNISTIKEATQLALEDTAESIKTNLIQSQTMPFASGDMQDIYTSVEERRTLSNSVRILVDTVYARKVYFDPEINIKQGKNPNAKQYWFEDYISGSKKDLPLKYFKKHLKRRLKQ